MTVHEGRALLAGLDAVLVALFLRSLGAGEGRALVLALLFAWHPLTAEAVSGSGTTSLVGAGALLVTLTAHARRLYGLVLGGAAVAVLCRPGFVLLPLLVALIDRWPLGRRATPRRSRTLWLVVAVAFVASLALHGAAFAELPLRLRSAPSEAFELIAATLWPVGAPPGFAPGAAAWVVLLGLSLVLLKRPRGTPAAFVGILIAVALGIESHGRLAGSSQLERLTSALEAAPHDLDVRAALGAELIARGRLSDAARLHAETLTFDESSFLARRELGRIALRRALIPGREFHLREAQQELTQAVQLEPSDAEAQLLLGEVLQRLGEYRPAREAFSAVDGNTRDTELRARAALRRAMVEYELGNRTPSEAPALLAASASSLERALELDPRSPEAWNVKGVLAMRANDIAGARSALLHALELEPDYSQARLQLARIHLAAGDAEEAERELLRALEVNADLTDALFELAVLNALQGREDKAIDLLRRTIAVRRNHVRANVALARLLIERGELDEAETGLNIVLNRVNPDHAEALRLMERIRASRAGRGPDPGGQR